MLVGAAAERDLVELLAILLDAQDADVADVMMAARVDAARDVDVQPPMVARERRIAEAAASAPAPPGSSAHWRGCNSRAPGRR
jgi:hypothetical protein